MGCQEAHAGHNKNVKGRPTAATLREIYQELFHAFGPQHWWPGETPFEVIVGAILTQNTAWTNAAAAIENLKRERLLSPSALKQIPVGRLARLIRSSGYFNQKARRLKDFVRYLYGSYQGDLTRMRRVSLARLRNELLGISGIGPETADSILLYAFGKPVFVVDAYTRRVLARHSFISWDATYQEIQQLFMDRLPGNNSLFNEYHALVVALGKGFCRKTKPKCPTCPLRKVGRLCLETPAAAKPF